MMNTDGQLESSGIFDKMSLQILRLLSYLMALLAKCGMK